SPRQPDEEPQPQPARWHLLRRQLRRPRQERQPPVVPPRRRRRRGHYQADLVRRLRLLQGDRLLVPAATRWPPARPPPGRRHRPDPLDPQRAHPPARWLEVRSRPLGAKPRSSGRLPSSGHPTRKSSPSATASQLGQDRLDHRISIPLDDLRPHPKEPDPKPVPDVVLPLVGPPPPARPHRGHRRRPPRPASLDGSRSRARKDPPDAAAETYRPCT